jgi:uncharacterized membrane protein
MPDESGKPTAEELVAEVGGSERAKGRYHLGLLRKSEYSVGEFVPFSSVFECLENGEFKAFKKGEVFTMPDEGGVEAADVTWVATDNIIEFITKNVNVEYDKIETVQLRIAEVITDFAGSMGFVYFHVAWFALWIAINNGTFGAAQIFDPFPYGLLTMIVSLEAIFLATFIMIAQNVQNKRSELRAELDYQTNISSEKGVAEILALLRELKEHEELAEEEILEAQVHPKAAKPRLRERLDEIKRKREEAKEEKIHDMDGMSDE